MSVDIVVPVHNGFEVTRRCLVSVLEWPQRTSCRVVVVDDASDDPRVIELLTGMAREGTIQLLRNEQNLGFVHSANRGMSFSTDTDVILLNSDTMVANDWLDRLRECALREPGIGTVTPFSNNATICSFPVFCADNPLPVGIPLERLDNICAAANAGGTVDLPTAVGFCMYIRRACLAEVGLFDPVAFGRGYGEENDFCRRALARGWRSVMAADVFVFHEGGASFRSERESLVARAEAALIDRHPDYPAAVRAFVRRDPLFRYRMNLEIDLARSRAGIRQADQGTTPGVQMHVAHDLGGGLERWCRDFGAGDTVRTNLILKSVCHGGDFGQGLMLYGADVAEPLWACVFEHPIAVTAASHPEYRQAIETLIRKFRVDTVIVSSFIGHALDILDTGLPTMVVAHDYSPVCPALNISFNGICRHCDAARLQQCYEENRDFNAPFLSFRPPERLAVREAYVRRLLDGNHPVVTPSHVVRRHLIEIEPRLERANFVTLPHGIDIPNFHTPRPPEKSRLRIVVLGMLAVSKGLRLLDDALAELTGFADIYLVGSREAGELFSGRQSVFVIPEYALDELPAVLATIRPHLGLLLSIVPETFSYTLSEFMALSIPPVATRLGAFAERIVEGETGILFAPDVAALLDQMRQLDADRAALDTVRNNLRALPRRTVADMVADYHRLLPVASPSPPRSGMVVDPGLSVAEARRLVELAVLGKRVKSQELLLGFKETRLQRLAAQRDEVRREADGLAQRIAVLEADLKECRRVNQALFASTSWRLSAPIRWVRLAWRWTEQTARRLEAGRRRRALPVVGRDTDDGAPVRWQQAAFEEYRAALETVRPALMSRVAGMNNPPLLSVLVPTFNTDEGMLRSMLDSVLAQWYPHWELCVADDGSSSAHVERVLREYAAADHRIRLDFSRENRGVAAASNRALGMAKGAMVVLLDHDDLLEPQALCRVAESCLAEAPDFLYSDEVIVAADGLQVDWLLFRPAFSPEYLRSHPYIVHLVAFRREFLLEIGAFDDSMRISQDYDLILRASERARLIVHVPEILYRWRTHPASAGHRYIEQVMEASKAVLERHLARTSSAGEVGDGPCFNFFDVRYACSSAVRVAIIIPSRNHGEMVRRCIESIEATAGTVAYDLILIDHESNEVDTVRYLDSLKERVRVLRYAGPFNYSAINNWAVDQLDRPYSHFLFCNNDVEALAPGWLDRMVALARQPGVGIVGAKLFYGGREQLQHAGVCVGAFTVAENLGRFRPVSPDTLDSGYLGSLIVNREVSAVTAACMLIRASVFEEIGGFDIDLAVLFGDVDLCLRAAARGYRVVYCHGAELIHHESVTRGRGRESEHADDCKRFVERWALLLELGDPYFNPNLSLTSSVWDISRPLGVRLECPRRLYRPGADGHQMLSSAVSPAPTFYWPSDGPPTTQA